MFLIELFNEFNHFFSAFPRYKALSEIPLTETTLNLKNIIKLI